MKAFRHLAALLLVLSALPCRAASDGLFLSDNDIKDIRSKIENYAWAKDAYNDLVKRASTEFPSSSFTNGIGMDVMQLKEAALVYRISGDETNLPKIKSALVAQYKLDSPDTPIYTESGSVSSSFWQDVMRYELRYIAIWDLVKDNALFQSCAPAMEKRIAESLSYMKYATRKQTKLNNTTFWIAAGLAAFGFYASDQEALDMAINGEWGFKTMLGKFVDGGRFNPEGPNYSFLYVDTAMYIIADLARRHGYPEDLYNWVSPVSGASLHKMALAMADISQPDGNIINKGDLGETIDNNSGGWLQPAGAAKWCFFDKALFGHESTHRVSDKAELIYSIWADPEYAWILSRTPGRKTHCDMFWGMLSLTHGVPEIGASTPPQAKSEVLSGMGTAFIKSVEGPLYWQSGALTATMSSGNYTTSHSHKDHFAITLNAFGKYLLNDWFLYWDYLAPRKGRANMTPISARAIAHNTVCVDCNDPGESEGKVRWSAIQRLGKAQVVSLSGSVYTGVEQTRTLCVTPDYAIDVFELSSSGSHTYDWFLHSRGSADYKGLSGWTPYSSLNKEYALGPIDTAAVSRPGNEWLLSPKAAESKDGKFTVTFSDADGLAVMTTVSAPEGSTVYDTSTPFFVPLNGWDKAMPAGIPERNPMTAVRVQGKNAVFAAVHQPLKSGTEKVDVLLDGDKIIVRGHGFEDIFEISSRSFESKNVELPREEGLRIQVSRSASGSPRKLSIVSAGEVGIKSVAWFIDDKPVSEKELELEDGPHKAKAIVKTNTSAGRKVLVKYFTSE